MNNVRKTDMETLYPLIEATISTGGSVKLKVSGFSMYPLVSSRRDSVVLVKADEIKKGDVPLFKRADGSYILHRVVGIKDGAYKVRGDYEQKIEYPIYPHQVVAVAKGFYRKERYISCDSFGYKLYKAFWMNSVVFRPLMFTLISILTRNKKSKKNVES